MRIIENIKHSTYEWLDERTKLSALSKTISKKVVPLHNHTIWYYFGGMAMFLFILQVVTGMLLMVYYQPGVETSYESVKFIMEKIPYGQLIRSIHSWAANLMVGVIFIHMFTAYFLKAYRRPRELTWLTGFGLFMITLGLGFSGYLLTWDELAFFATKVGLQIMDQSPIIGPIMATLLRGGAELGNATIGRFFELHVLILPLSIMGLLGAHLLLVQLHGMSTPESYTNKPAKLRKSIPFFSDFLYHDMFIWALMLGGIILLANAVPWELGPKVDPWAAAPEGIKPEWYFLFMFQILKMLPAHVGPIEGEVFGIIMFGVAGALWALVPFWEGINKFTSKLATFYGVVAVVVIITTTSMAYMEKKPEHAAGSTPSGAVAVASNAPVKASSATALPAPAGDVQKAGETFKQSCAACHSIGGGQLVGPDLKDITNNRDREQLANFIVDPSGSAMPQIAGIDKATALSLLDYIESESNPGKKQEPAPASDSQASEEKPFLPADVEAGQKIFAGVKPLANAGTACAACHSVKGEGALGGGTLGPDLTDAYARLGGQKGLNAWLSAIPSPTMKPIYEAHPLQPEESHALVAYLANVSGEGESKPLAKEATSGPLQNKFLFFGVIGFVSAMVAIAALYHNRFRSVRRALVQQSQENHGKENNH